MALSRYQFNPNVVVGGLLLATGAALHAYGTSESNYVDARTGEHAEGAPLSEELAEHNRRADLADGVGNIALGAGMMVFIFTPIETVRKPKEEQSK